MQRILRNIIFDITNAYIHPFTYTQARVYIRKSIYATDIVVVKTYYVSGLYVITTVAHGCEYY